jgi:hypothetical protein
METPILAAVTGAVVGGIISGVINLLSLGIQYIMNERHQKNKVEREWVRDTHRLLNELKREVMRYDPSEDPDNTDVIDSLIDDLEEQKGIMPDRIDTRELESTLSDVLLANTRRELEDYYDSMYEYRSEMINKSESGIKRLRELQN